MSSHPYVTQQNTPLADDTTLICKAISLMLMTLLCR